MRLERTGTHWNALERIWADERQCWAAMLGLDRGPDKSDRPAPTPSRKDKLRSASARGLVSHYQSPWKQLGRLRKRRNDSQQWALPQHPHDCRQASDTTGESLVGPSHCRINQFST